MAREALSRCHSFSLPSPRPCYRITAVTFTEKTQLRLEIIESKLTREEVKCQQMCLSPLGKETCEGLEMVVLFNRLNKNDKTVKDMSPKKLRKQDAVKRTD